MNPVSRFLGWWVDELARVVEPLVVRHGRPAGFVVVDTGGRYQAWRVNGRNPVLLGTADAADLGAADWARKLRSRPFELRLEAGRLLDRTLSLPAAGRQYLEAILRHQIERLTPWAADRVVFDYEIVEDGEAATDDQMRIRLVATARERVAAALAPLEAAGLTPRAVGTAADPLGQATSIDLQDSSKTLRRDALRRKVGIVLAAFAALAVLAGGVQSWLVYDLSVRSEALDAAIETRRAVITEAVARTSASAGHQQLAARKAAALPMVLLVEELSKRIPTDTYLTELSIDGQTLRINGLSSRATELIALIEQSPMLSAAQFAAPTTRTEDGAADSFQILARLPSQSQQGDQP